MFHLPEPYDVDKTLLQLCWASISTRERRLFARVSLATYLVYRVGLAVLIIVFVVRAIVGEPLLLR